VNNDKSKLDLATAKKLVKKIEGLPDFTGYETLENVDTMLSAFNVQRLPITPLWTTEIISCLLSLTLRTTKKLSSFKLPIELTRQLPTSLLFEWKLQTCKSEDKEAVLDRVEQIREQKEELEALLNQSILELRFNWKRQERLKQTELCADVVLGCVDALQSLGNYFDSTRSLESFFSDIFFDNNWIELTNREHGKSLILVCYLLKLFTRQYDP
jgi:hypothetical protein